MYLIYRWKEEPFNKDKNASYIYCFFPLWRPRDCGCRCRCVSVIISMNSWAPFIRAAAFNAAAAFAAISAYFLASASQSGVCTPTCFPSNNFSTLLFLFLFSLSSWAYLIRCLKLLSFLLDFFWSLVKFLGLVWIVIVPASLILAHFVASWWFSSGEASNDVRCRFNRSFLL